MTPIVTEELGKPAYGFWTLLVACTGSYSLLDLGIRSAVGQFVTRYWSRGELENVSRTISTSVALMAGTGLCVALVATGFAWFGPELFEISGATDEQASMLFAIVGYGVALNFPLVVAQSATFARQRFDLSNAIGISEILIRSGLIVWVLKSDPQDLPFFGQTLGAANGLYGLAILTVSMQLLAGLVRVFIARKLLPGVELARRHVRRENVKELYGYSIFTVLINAGDQVMTHSPAFVLAWLLNDEAAGHFGPGANLVFYGLTLISAIAWTLTPQATARDAVGDMDAVRRMWVQGSRLILTFGGILAGGIAATGEDFIRLWVGEEFLSDPEYISTATIASVLVIGLLVRSTMTTGRQILIGMRRVRFMAAVSLTEAAIGISLSIVLVHQIGIIGCAVGMATSATIAQLGLMPRYLSKELGVPVGEFFREVPWGGVAVVLVMLGTEWLVRPHLTVDGWLTYCVKAAAVTTPGVIAALALGTNAEERARLGRKLGVIR